MTTGTRRRVVRQKAKGPVDPSVGLQVRKLRTAKGMTQAQLAGNDFTKGFISLLETGRTRVSLRAAQVLAARLGVAAADLLRPELGADGEVELGLIQAEGELREGRPAITLEHVRALETRASGVLAARLERLKGLAQLANGQLREAIRSLDRARRAFGAVGQREYAARAAFDLAQAHGRADEHGESIVLALECERALESGQLVDRTLELKVLAYLASKFVTIGDAVSADRYAERARALAEDVVDPAAVAHLYMSLAITRQEQGDLEAALQYARRGLGAYEQLGDRRQIASAWNTIGWVNVKRGQLGRAEEALARAQREAEAISDERALGYILQTRGELELARGRPKEAVRLANESAARPNVSPRCRALSRLLRAEALARTRAPLTDVRRAFAEAFRALEPEGSALLAQAHRAYFDVLRQRGELREATQEAQKALELLRPQVS